MKVDQARRPARIDSLDALRGLCDLSVALFHFHTTGTITNLPLFRHSWMFVDFFFVLSGFVITAAYAEDLHRSFSISRFLCLRLARIWPLHAVMLLLFIALEATKLIVEVAPFAPMFASPRDPGSLVLNLLLLQVFGFYDYVTWNAPSWSIAAEFWVYGIAAFLFRVAGKERPAVLIAIAATCALVMLGSGAPFLNLTYDGAVVRCLYGFAIGSLAWSVFTRGRDWTRDASSSSPRILWTVAEAAILSTVLAAVWHLDSGPVTIALPLLFGLCVLVLAQQGGLVSAWLSRKVPVWLGTISYSIYMTHLFVEGRLLDVLTLAGRWLDMPMVERVIVDGAAKRVVVGSAFFINGTIVALLVLILAVSYGSYRFVERPCNQWVRARMSRASTPLVKSPAT
jgi:peptidoglycan/LPS O-acetylase OafA/YrhL